MIQDRQFQDQLEQKAVWSSEETSAFIKYLYENRSRAVDGGNFDGYIFAAAARAISHLLESGPKKTRKMCKMKWSSIKSIYTSILEYQGISEMHWDNINGADINTEAEESVWNDYVAHKCNYAMKAFRNTGWEHYDQVQAIVRFTPNAGLGSHAFSPLSAPPVFGDSFDSDSEESGSDSHVMSESSEMYSSRHNDETMNATIAIHNIQASINQLNETLSRLLDKMDSEQPDQQMTRSETLERAIKLLQQEDGLSIDETIYIARYFTEDFEAAYVYLLLKPELRAGWLEKQLSSSR